MKKRQEGEWKESGRNRYPDGGRENWVEGRHSVLEAFRAGQVVERVYVLKGCQDGPVLNILREAKRSGTLVDFVPGDRLDHMSSTGKHQGVIAQLSAFSYSTMEDVFAQARSGARIRLYLCWMELRIRIIWALLSELRIWRGRMALLYRSAGLSVLRPRL